MYQNIPQMISRGLNHPLCTEKKLRRAALVGSNATGLALGKCHQCLIHPTRY